MKITQSKQVITNYRLDLNNEEFNILINSIHWKILRIEEKYKKSGNNNEKILQELRYQLAITKKLQSQLLDQLN